MSVSSVRQINSPSLSEQVPSGQPLEKDNSNAFSTHLGAASENMKSRHQQKLSSEAPSHETHLLEKKNSQEETTANSASDNSAPNPALAAVSTQETTQSDSPSGEASPAAQTNASADGQNKSLSTDDSQDSASQGSTSQLAIEVVATTLAQSVTPITAALTASPEEGKAVSADGSALVKAGTLVAEVVTPPLTNSKDAKEIAAKEVSSTSKESVVTEKLSASIPQTSAGDNKAGNKMEVSLLSDPLTSLSKEEEAKIAATSTNLPQNASSEQIKTSVAVVETLPALEVALTDSKATTTDSKVAKAPEAPSAKPDVTNSSVSATIIPTTDKSAVDVPVVPSITSVPSTSKKEGAAANVGKESPSVEVTKNEVPAPVSTAVINTSSLTAPQVSKPQTQAPVPVSELHQAVTGRIEFLAHEGGGEASFKITPEGMGEINIQVSVKDGHVHAQVTASSGDIAKLLQSGSGELSRSLSDKGLSLGSFTVSSDASGTNSQGRSASDTQTTAQRFLGSSSSRSTSSPVVTSKSLRTADNIPTNGIDVFA